MGRSKILVCALFMSGLAAAQAPAPPQGDPRPPGNDFLEAKNESAGTVKLEYFAGNAPPRDGVRPVLMSCVNSGATVYWPIDAKDAVGTVRVQSSPECGGQGDKQVACRSEMQRTPRLRHIAVRSDGNNCAMVALPPPAGAMLKADQPCGPSGAWGALTIENKTRHGLWVTVYEFYRTNTVGDILAAACWMPGEKRMACVERRNLYVRPEVGNNNPGTATARSCSEATVPGADGRGFNVDMRQMDRFYLSYSCNSKNCRWD